MSQPAKWIRDGGLQRRHCDRVEGTSIPDSWMTITPSRKLGQIFAIHMKLPFFRQGRSQWWNTSTLDWSTFSNLGTYRLFKYMRNFRIPWTIMENLDSTRTTFLRKNLHELVSNNSTPHLSKKPLNPCSHLAPVFHGPCRFGITTIDPDFVNSRFLIYRNRDSANRCFSDKVRTSIEDTGQWYTKQLEREKKNQSSALHFVYSAGDVNWTSD